jgi:hypothetical protein
MFDSYSRFIRPLDQPLRRGLGQDRPPCQEEGAD